MATITTLELEIKQITRTSAEKINEIASALTNLYKASKDADSSTVAMRQQSIALQDLSKTAKGLSSAMGRLDKLGSEESSEKFKRMAKSLKAFASAASGADMKNLKSIGTVLNAVVRATGKSDDIGRGLEKIGASIAQFAQQAQALNGLDANVIRALSKFAGNGNGSQGTATTAVSKFNETIGSTTSKLGMYATRLATLPFRSLIDKIKAATKSAGNLLRSFKRIAVYRGIRSAIRMLTQGLAEGVKHLYKWASIVGNSFKTSMDKLSTSANYLRNSFGAMVSPIIDALVPVLDILIDRLVDAMNMINQFLATITGADTWRKATKQQREYSEETDNAADAQKRLNHQLMAFDELNNISKASGGNGGGGGKDNGVDDNTFTEEKIPDWAKAIKEAMNNGMWKTAGALLAQNINELIDGWNAEDWGKKIGEKISNGLDFYNGLMSTVNWQGLGKKVADFFDALIDEVPAESVGEAIVQKFNAAIGFLKGFTENFNWAEAGIWLVDVLVSAFTSINWKDLGELIGNLAGGLLTFLKEGFNELLSRKDEVLDAIGDFFSGLGWDGLVNVVELSAIVGGMKILFSSVFGDKGLINSVKTSVGNMLTSGLSGGAMGTLGLAITLEAVFVGNLWDNIKEYGWAKGIIKTVGSEASDFNFIMGSLNNMTTPAIALEIALKLQSNEFEKSMQNLLDSGAVQNFIEFLNGLLRAMGFKEINLQFKQGEKLPSKGGLPTSNKKTTNQNDKGALFDPTTGEWFIPKLDTTQQVSAINKIKTAATNTKKKLVDMPPSDKQISKFTGAMEKEKNSVHLLSDEQGLIKTAWKTMPPTKEDREKLREAMQREKSSVGLVTGEVDSIVSGLQKAAKGAAIPVTDKSGNLSKAATDSSALATNLASASKKTTVTVETTGLSTAAKKAAELNEALKNSKGNWKINVTSDLRLKSANGTVYTLEPPDYASGGFPQGDIFVANEAGPELVGTINGRTAVASNNEITGIADAVYNTGADEAALLREQNALLRQILSKSMNVTLSPNVAAGRWVTQAQTAYRKATGG